MSSDTIPSLKMALDHGVAHRNERLVGAVTALEPGILKDAADPFVLAGRCIAGFARLRIFPAAREDIFPTSEQASEQSNFADYRRFRRHARHDNRKPFSIGANRAGFLLATKFL